MGVIGFGDIGRAVAGIAKCFGMNVLVNTRTPKDRSFEYVDLETLFRKSDVISLHCPLTKETHHLIQEKTIALMKPTAMIIKYVEGSSNR